MVYKCTDCKRLMGEQHRPSCHRQGLVTRMSDYDNPFGALEAAYLRVLKQIEDAGLCKWEYRERPPRGSERALNLPSLFAFWVPLPPS